MPRANSRATSRPCCCALEDTENALVRYAKAREEDGFLQRAATDSGRAAALARIRFEAGAGTLLEVLDAERTKLQAQDALAQSRTRSLVGVVALYRAMAGGWPKPRAATRCIALTLRYTRPVPQRDLAWGGVRMVFNSLTFVVFFAIVLALHAMPLSWTTKKVNLLIASYLFYAAWNPPFIILLWVSTVVDWYAAQALVKAQGPGRAPRLDAAVGGRQPGHARLLQVRRFRAGEFQQR